MRVDIVSEPPDALTDGEKREWEAIASAAMGEGPGGFRVTFVLDSGEWITRAITWGHAERDAFRVAYNDEVAPARAAITRALAEQGKAVRREGAVSIDWQPSKPEGWQECEVRIRKRIREHVEHTAYKGQLLRVEVHLTDMAGSASPSRGTADKGWRCRGVWSEDENDRCSDSFDNVVDDALMKCSLP